MMTRRFTGWHMAAILLLGFGVIIAVNAVMATAAVRTFGGAIVENSYVASQRYNGWLSEARAQNRLGWHVEAQGTPGGALVVTLSGRGAPIEGALVALEAEHPLGRVPGRAFALTGTGGGRYEAVHALPAGRWRLRIEARGHGQDARFVQDVRL